MLKLLLLSHLFAPRSQPRPVSPPPGPPPGPLPGPLPDNPEAPLHHDTLDTDDPVLVDIDADNDLDNDITDDNDVDDNNPDDDDDDDQDDVDDQPTPSRRIFRRRRLSISRTYTTFSTLVDNARFKISFSWLRRFLNLLRPENESPEYLPNYRHTPIISGIIIPFSILLAIPGFTEHWYIRTEQNKTVETKKNSALLDVALAFSMLCAVIANICLVARFMEKRVKTMTILCVVFLSIHGASLTTATTSPLTESTPPLDVINIITVTIFGVVHSSSDGFTYGQSFWMTVCSTIASFITNITLIVDLVRTPDFAKSGMLGKNQADFQNEILTVLILR